MIGWDLAVGILNTCAMFYKCVYACMLYIFNCTGSVQVSKVCKIQICQMKKKKIHHLPILEKPHHPVVPNLFQILNPFENLLKIMALSSSIMSGVPGCPPSSS